MKDKMKVVVEFEPTEIQVKGILKNKNQKGEVLNSEEIVFSYEYKDGELFPIEEIEKIFYSKSKFNS